MKLRVGVDTGGTFTDCVVIDEQGRIHTLDRAVQCDS
jgi:N-methylhydantoinase A/oxoprolinase/acetone carboxylase beta subunit